MFEIKTRSKIIKMIILLLFIVCGLTASFAWVIDSKKSKVDTEEVLISKTEGLEISLDNFNYSSYLSLSSVAEYQSVELKDLSGDGIGLYSALIDAFTKQAIANGWNYVRTDANDYVDAEQVEILKNRNENKTYYCFDVYFRSTVKLNVYLYQDSYVEPSTSEMNTLNDGKTYCLFLRRTCTSKLVGDTNKYYYTYETENGIIGLNISEDEKAEFEKTMPIVYNRSSYNFDFDNDKDYLALLSGESKNVQTQYSANYIAGGIRVACINNDYYDSTNPSLSDYRNVTDDDYSETRLRMIWAPNPEYRLTRIYNAQKDSSTYSFDILNYEETYYNSQNKKIGRMVEYKNGDKYYYVLGTPDNVSTEEFVLYVSGNAYYKIDGSNVTQLTKTSSEVTKYNNLISSTEVTLNNEEDRSDSQVTTDNNYYTLNGSTAVQESLPLKMFTNKLNTSTENLDNCQILTTLEKDTDSEYYFGKCTFVIWVEGTDNEASISLTTGNGKGTLKGSGTSKIQFGLSFLGAMTVEETEPGTE